MQWLLNQLGSKFRYHGDKKRKYKNKVSWISETPDDLLNFQFSQGHPWSLDKAIL